MRELLETPRDPIAAVTHPDPYPYYADLVATRPLYRDEALGLWVAAGAGAVTAVLTSDLCRVRPPSEPVPATLAGSPAGEIFRRFVRMTDGPHHCPRKRAVTAALASVDAAQTAAASRESARRLLQEALPAGFSGSVVGALLDLAFRLPVHTVGSLLGILPGELARMQLEVQDFAHCLAPAADPAAVERGNVAAGRLLDRVRRLLRQPESRLLAVLAEEAERAGSHDLEAIAANAVGFLFQAYEATAGLIGNTLRALAARPAARNAVAADSRRLRDVVQEVLRHDPPVHNTRRFVARDGEVAGHEMLRDDVVLVVLAAANRDPAANPFPDRFDLGRRERRIFTFGTGPHACPGEALAATIAEAGAGEILAAGIDLEELAGPVGYHPYANLRIPRL